MSKLIEYIKETRNEMKHVSWPTRKQATGYTVAVILISIVISFYLGIFDTVFSFLLDKLIMK